MAALAARVSREIVAIDTTRMSRAPRELVDALRAALVRAALHGLVPVLSGLDEIDPTDTELREKVRQVLRVHPGPIVVRTSPEGNLPLDPGFVSIQLPLLSDTPTNGILMKGLRRRIASVRAGGVDGAGNVDDTGNSVGLAAENTFAAAK